MMPWRALFLAMLCLNLAMAQVALPLSQRSPAQFDEFVGPPATLEIDPRIISLKQRLSALGLELMGTKSREQKSQETIELLELREHEKEQSSCSEYPGYSDQEEASQQDEKQWDDLKDGLVHQVGKALVQIDLKKRTELPIPLFETLHRLSQEFKVIRDQLSEVLTDHTLSDDERRNLFVTYMANLLLPFRSLQTMLTSQRGKVYNHHYQEDLNNFLPQVSRDLFASPENLVETNPKNKIGGQKLQIMSQGGIMAILEGNPFGLNYPDLFKTEKEIFSPVFSARSLLDHDVKSLLLYPTYEHLKLSLRWATMGHILTKMDVYKIWLKNFSPIKLPQSCLHHGAGNLPPEIPVSFQSEPWVADQIIDDTLANMGLVSGTKNYEQHYLNHIDLDPTESHFNGLRPFESYRHAQAGSENDDRSQVDDFRDFPAVMEVLAPHFWSQFTLSPTEEKHPKEEGEYPCLYQCPKEKQLWITSLVTIAEVQIDEEKRFATPYPVTSFMKKEMEKRGTIEWRDLVSSDLERRLKYNKLTLPKFPSFQSNYSQVRWSLRALATLLERSQKSVRLTRILKRELKAVCQEESLRVIKGQRDNSNLCFKAQKLKTPKEVLSDLNLLLDDFKQLGRYLPNSSLSDPVLIQNQFNLSSLWNRLITYPDLISSYKNEWEFLENQIESHNPWALLRLTFLLSNELARQHASHPGSRLMAQEVYKAFKKLGLTQPLNFAHSERILSAKQKKEVFQKVVKNIDEASQNILSAKNPFLEKEQLDHFQTLNGLNFFTIEDLNQLSTKLPFLNKVGSENDLEKTFTSKQGLLAGLYYLLYLSRDEKRDQELTQHYHQTLLNLGQNLKDHREIASWQDYSELMDGWAHLTQKEKSKDLAYQCYLQAKDQSLIESLSEISSGRSSTTLHQTLNCEFSLLAINPQGASRAKEVMLKTSELVKKPYYRALLKRSAAFKYQQMQELLPLACEKVGDRVEDFKEIFYAGNQSLEMIRKEMAFLPPTPERLQEMINKLEDWDWKGIRWGVGSAATVIGTIILLSKKAALLTALSAALGPAGIAIGGSAILLMASASLLVTLKAGHVTFSQKLSHDKQEARVERYHLAGLTDEESVRAMHMTWFFPALELLFIYPVIKPATKGFHLAALTFKRSIGLHKFHKTGVHRYLYAMRSQFDIEYAGLSGKQALKKEKAWMRLRQIRGVQQDLNNEKSLFDLVEVYDSLYLLGYTDKLHDALGSWAPRFKQIVSSAIPDWAKRSRLNELVKKPELARAPLKFSRDLDLLELDRRTAFSIAKYFKGDSSALYGFVQKISKRLGKLEKRLNYYNSLSEANQTKYSKSLIGTVTGRQGKIEKARHLLTLKEEVGRIQLALKAGMDEKTFVNFIQENLETLDHISKTYRFFKRELPYEFLIKGGPYLQHRSLWARGIADRVILQRLLTARGILYRTTLQQRYRELVGLEPSKLYQGADLYFNTRNSLLIAASKAKDSNLEKIVSKYDEEVFKLLQRKVGKTTLQETEGVNLAQLKNFAPQELGQLLTQGSEAEKAFLGALLDQAGKKYLLKKNYLKDALFQAEKVLKSQANSVEEFEQYLLIRVLRTHSHDPEVLIYI